LGVLGLPPLHFHKIIDVNLTNPQGGHVP